MKIFYCCLIVLFVSACSTKIQTSQVSSEPQVYQQPFSNKFSYPLNKNETISFVVDRLSNSSFHFEQNKDDLDFLIISYSTTQPDQFIDCGKTTITDKNKTEILNNKTFANTKSGYKYQKYRLNHLDTYDIQNRLSISANVITTGDENRSNTIVQPRFILKVRKSISSTQGGAKRELKKYKLQLAPGERKPFDAFGTNCTSTGKFEEMIQDALSPHGIM